MTTHRINLRSIGSERAFAALIEGFNSAPGDTILVADGFGATCAVRVGGDFPELDFTGDDYRTASVTIQRPDVRPDGSPVPARASWSSSPPSSPGLGDAAATASLLAWAASVAKQLNDWARDGELPRLVREPTFAEGTTVDVKLSAPGGADPRVVGSVRGVVLNAGGEYDVVIDMELEDIEDVEHLLGRCDVSLDDLYDRHAGRYVLRNCQPEWLTAVAA